jgi:hypothetical protein
MDVSSTPWEDQQVEKIMPISKSIDVSEQKPVSTESTAGSGTVDVYETWIEACEAELNVNVAKEETNTRRQTKIPPFERDVYFDVAF